MKHNKKHINRLIFSYFILIYIDIKRLKIKMTAIYIKDIVLK